MSAAPEQVIARHGVVIAVDPHKASWTAVVVTADLAAAAAIRVEVNRAGYRQLRRFAAAWPDARWAIEGAVGLGAPLAQRLREDQIAVIDVPAKLARRVRLLSTGHGRKSDQADALSVGIAAWSAQTLRAVQIDDAIAALRAVTEHRDDMVRARTQLINRLHAVMVKLVPSGLARGLSAEAAAEALRRVRPRDSLGRTLRTIAADLVTELRRLDRRIAEATQTLRDAVTASGTTLTALLGIGDVVAAKMLARTGPVGRFASSAAFASYCGVAPIEVSSGDVVRHRLSRAGDRQLNYALHVMALSQIRYDSPGRSYYQRKRAAGKNHKEAMRCLKRRLTDVVYRTMTNDSVSSPSPAA
ncbi:IS110 family RNA-guided transposase [Jatrophihabitans lederbergiae]|uniref:IS110 family transposase n=1 Tax=Jatrophihabitans lederbergiae TaxID=3075547 RepID=A0ABU2JIH2_9ACTN|nr:IS110 family transposase [Jatrophihabitans sp. DSM 44399]MDT0264561.1 IS110 family transposase [Jatrophihabitans sp. DSM 44399]